MRPVTVDVQDGLLILMPHPQDVVAHLAGLHQEVREGADAAAHIQEEREAWDI